VVERGQALWCECSSARGFVQEHWNRGFRVEKRAFKILDREDDNEGKVKLEVIIDKKKPLLPG